MERNWLHDRKVQEELRKMGAPTFEQFKRNRDKYAGRGRVQETLASIDRGSHQLGMVQKHIYEIKGRRFDSLERVEDFAADYNIPLTDFTAEIIPQCGGKCDILVKFMCPEEREARSSW